MSDKSIDCVHDPEIYRSTVQRRVLRSFSFPKSVVIFKLLCDIAFSVAAIPLIVLVGTVLALLNPIFNPGPLLYSQYRMGKHMRRFRMWKFRTMLPVDESVRAHDAKVEQHRITPLGRFLRQTRCDELPNFFNVLCCHMSVIGPRPDAWSHAEVYIASVPHYAERFRLRPGISGLAQVRGGYADMPGAIRRKARLDRIYTEQFDIRLELYIILRTFSVIFTGNGAK